MNGLRTVLAPNASPMTLDGTRTFIIGRQQAAVIDPGPDLPAHLDAVAAELAGAREVSIVLTHRHPDHAAGAPGLASRLAAVAVNRGPTSFSEGDVVLTDAGELHLLATPGHTPDHLALHFPAEAAIFCGDLMMGGLDTALVAPPEGHLGDYLESLDRLARIAPRVIYPTHGPEFTDPARDLARYRVHRSARLREVLAAVEEGKRRLADIAEYVYGAGVAPELRSWIEGTTLAYLEYLVETGMIEEGVWHDD